VSEVDDKGQVLTEFTDVNGPYYLSTTSKDDVLVADCSNDRIVLLNSQLRLERVLLDKNSQVKPLWSHILHYNERTSQLHVLHSSSTSSDWGLLPDVISQWSLR